ncbi:MAG: hypothetical protein JSR76_02250 [Verrucomicrobia bacterium]|nr:hypothetical protein [Verrucomicrobiota bacterium]
MRYILFLGALFLLFFSIPYILSTPPLKPPIERLLSRKAKVPIKFAKATFRWQGPQVLREVSLPESFSLQEVRVADSFPTALLASHHKIRGVNGTFSGDPKTTLEMVEVETGPVVKVTGVTSSDGKKGSFRIEGDKDWKISLQEMPSRLVQSYFPKLPLVSILGTRFNADIYVAEDKEMRATITSPTFRLSTKGRLDKEVFYPTENSYVVAILTEALSNELFKESSVKPVSATHIELMISAEGCRIGPAIEEIQIPKAELALNKIVFRNFGTLSDLISVVELRLRPNQDVMIWFQKTPISFFQGKLKLESRCEMLIDQRYELGLWGDIDLKKAKAHLVIGLTPDVLAKVFNLKDIPRNYTIPMKLDGPFTALHLHKSHAIKQIAALLLLQQSKLPLIWPEEKTPSPRPPYPWR